MDFFSNAKKHAHPKAQSLMNEDFFWSPIDEAGPFGSDSGSDAAQGFNEWRKANNTTDPVEYLRELLVSWGMPLLDWNELDSSKINEFIQRETGISAETIEMLKETFKNQPEGQNKLSDEAYENIIQQSSAGMGRIYLLQMDNAIIGTGFAQFAMEGKIDVDLQYLAHTAIKRQLSPILIDAYNPGNKKIRQQILSKMMTVIEAANL